MPTHLTASPPLSKDFSLLTSSSVSFAGVVSPPTNPAIAKSVCRHVWTSNAAACAERIAP